MKRNLSQLAEKEYDLVILGGGIYGAAAVWEASRQGLSAVLVEMKDFGGATSSNSLKIIHGGLRYLQQLDFIRMRESIRERRIMMQLAPHFVHPIKCVMPTFGHLMKGREVMFAGMLLNDIISIDRNQNNDPEKKIPMGRVISRKRCLDMIPFLDGDNINGGAMWTDAQVYNTERLILSFILSAAEMGADVANYVKGSELVLKDKQIRGVKVKDLLKGDSFIIKSKAVLNTCGAWINKLPCFLNGKLHDPEVRLSTAMNLVVKKKLLDGNAAGVYSNYISELPDGSSRRIRRVLFMTPWRDYTIIGTFHRSFDGDPDGLKVREEEIAEALKEVNTATPATPVTRDDVTFFYKGFLPMEGINKKSGEVGLTKHYKMFDHEKRDGIKGLLSLSGVKYTTARDVAEKSINIILKKLERKGRADDRRLNRLYGGDIERFDDFLKNSSSDLSGKFSEKVSKHLVLNYGSEYRRVVEQASVKPELGRLLNGSDEVLQAEVVYAVREEMAQKLSDVVLRRTDLGSGECPADETLKQTAEIMAKELGWNSKRVEAEIAEVKKIYIPVK